MTKKIIIAAFAALALTPNAYAVEEKPIYLDNSSCTLFGNTSKKEIYFLDNYVESAKSSGANIDIITREDLKKQNNPSLSEVLNFVGSVSTQNSNGSEGSPTTVRVRGTDRIRFIIDGVRADRPSMTTPGVESQFFLTDDLERIEVIKGPQGNVLGTNASGGVIAAQTRQGRGPLSLELESGMGNYSLFKERFAIMGGDEKKDFYLSTTWFKNDGGMRTSNLGRIYNDAYNNLNVVSNLGLRILDDKAEIRDIFRFSRAAKGVGIGYNSEYPYNTYQDPNSFSRNIDIMNTLSFKHAPTEKYYYDTKFGLYHNQYNYNGMTNNIDPYYSSTSDISSTRLNFMTQHNYKILPWNTISLGYNLESEFIGGSSFEGTTSPYFPYSYTSKYDGNTIQNDVYINDAINIKDKLFIRGGARLVNNSQYGTYVAPNASAALVLPTFKIKGAQTKLRGSYGYSVNTPTLYQRYGTFVSAWGATLPNPDLKAEKYQSWDVGIEQSFLDDKLKLEFGYFNSNYRDYINYEYIGITYDGHYANIDEARIQGYEAKATWEFNDKFKLVFNYTYTDSEDKTTGLDLPGTPRNRFAGMAYWTPVERFTMYAGVETGSERRMSSSPYNKDIAPSYVDAKLGAEVRLFTYKGLSAYLRGNIYNLFNQNICMYKTGSTYYYAPGIHFSAGIFLKYNLPEKEKV